MMDGLGFAPGTKTSIQQILDVVDTGKAKMWITDPTQPTPVPPHTSAS